MPEIKDSAYSKLTEYEKCLVDKQVDKNRTSDIKESGYPKDSPDMSKKATEEIVNNWREGITPNIEQLKQEALRAALDTSRQR